MIELKFNSAVLRFRIAPVLDFPVKYFVLSHTMKLHFLDRYKTGKDFSDNLHIVEHNGLHTIAYPMSLLEKYHFQATKSIYQGFLNIDDAPDGYRRGCNYTIDRNNQCVVLHTMR